MSMIGTFGLCAQNNYDNLVSAIKDNQLDKVEDLVKKICDELENEIFTEQSNMCSGEVYIALFQYFEGEFGIDFEKNEDFNRVRESWREITGDYDIVVFSEIEKNKFLSYEDRIDHTQIQQYINEFFEEDYGNAGEIACNNFFESLRKIEKNSVLIWHLC